MPWITVQRDLGEIATPSQRQLATEAIGKIKQPDETWQKYELWQLSSCLKGAGLLHAALDYAELYLTSTTSNLQDWNMQERSVHLLTALGHFERAIGIWTERVAKFPDEPMSQKQVFFGETNATW